MKRALVLAAVSEAATGAALLIVPSLVGRLLLGEELTGVATPVARMAGGRPARDPDGTVGSGIHKRQGDDNIEGKKPFDRKSSIGMPVKGRTGPLLEHTTNREEKRRRTQALRH